MICIVFMWNWTKKITILNLVNVLESNNATLYNVVAAQHLKRTITIFGALLDVPW